MTGKVQYICILSQGQCEQILLMFHRKIDAWVYINHCPTQLHPIVICMVTYLITVHVYDVSELASRFSLVWLILNIIAIPFMTQWDSTLY